MLIEIDEDFEDAILDDSGENLVCLSTLLDASIKGKHFVFARRRTLEFLASCEKLYMPARQNARVLASKYAELASLQRTIQEKLIVSSSVSGVSRIGEQVWRLGADVIAKASLSSCTLLAEDSDDCEFYRISGRHYLSTRKFSGVAVSLSIHGGGGNSTSDQLEAILRERERFCLCITDSDRVAPNAPKKETARQCETVAQDYCWPARHVTLECRELENLMPLAWYEECVPTEAASRYVELRTLSDALGRDFYRYCDLKEGIRYSDIWSMGVGSPGFIFWYDFVRRRVEKFGGQCSCGNDIFDENSQLTDCDCFAIPPLGRNALRWLGERWRSDGHLHRLLKVAERDESLPDWIEIGRRVFEWGLALPPLRA